MLTNENSTFCLYDRANQLISTSLSGVTSLYAYNGDGVRLKQVVAGVVTTYTQDLVAPLPVVLQAKTGVTTTKYLFSLGTRPLAQNSTAWEYLLSDGLGSVRQIANANGYIIRTQDYEPYGSVLNSSGSSQSTYGFTGEERDQSGLIFLRARYMQPQLGIFLTRDPWLGDQLRPRSINGYGYVESDPINATDPSGYIAQAEETNADNIRAELQNNYAVIIPKDYGTGPNYTGTGQCGNRWYEGFWKTINELTWTKKAIADMATTMGDAQKFKSAMRGSVTLARRGITKDPFPLIGPIRPFAPPAGRILGDVNLPDYTFSNSEDYAEFNIVHELGHVWDRRTGLQLSQGMLTDKNIHTRRCEVSGYNGQTVCRFDITAGSEPPPGYYRVQALDDWRQEYAATSAMEDWAESFASVVYPAYFVSGQPLGPNRRQYVQLQIRAIP